MAYRVCVSPSNQDDNPYAWGSTTEAAQCKRIADAVCAALNRSGIDTICPHMDGMAEKCWQSDDFNADLHLPIHSNASVAHNAVGTRVYCSSFGSKGHDACKAIFKYLAPLTPSGGDGIKEAPTWYEVRIPAAPTAYVEVDFHDVPEVARWIIEHTADCGEAIAQGVCDYFGVAYVPAPADSKDFPSIPYVTKDELEAALSNLFKVYHTVEELPGWAEWTKELVRRGVIRGVSASDLALDYNTVRVVEFLGRTGALGEKGVG